jgi:hypothetical protein
MIIVAVPCPGAADLVQDKEKMHALCSSGVGPRFPAL